MTLFSMKMNCCYTRVGVPLVLLYVQTPFNGLDAVLLGNCAILVLAHMMCRAGVMPLAVHAYLPLLPFVSSLHCFVATVQDGSVVLQALLKRSAAKQS